jgi:uncharacterized protein (TIGR00251 family)
MARIAVKVHPSARRTAITGKLGDAYKLDVAAPPAQGKANAACIEFLADLAGMPRPRVRIVSGLTNQRKLVEIDGITQEELESKLPK